MNQSDENLRLEAKSGSGKSTLESISSFFNEPNLDGGTILIGTEKDEATLFPHYSVKGIEKPPITNSDTYTKVF